MPTQAVNKFGRGPACRSGTYLIRCVPTGQVYVGGTIGIKNRWAWHRGSLRRGDHFNYNLQAAWNEYGESEFEFEVLELVEPTRVLEREQHYVDALGACDPATGFNLCPLTGTSRGVKRSEEFRNNVVELNRNRSPETRAKIAEANRNRSPEILAKIAEANRGKIMLPETRAKISAANRGRTLTPEQRAKIGDANRRRVQACN